MLRCHKAHDPRGTPRGLGALEIPAVGRQVTVCSRRLPGQSCCERFLLYNGVIAGHGVIIAY